MSDAGLPFSSPESPGLMATSVSQDGWATTQRTPSHPTPSPGSSSVLLTVNRPPWGSCVVVFEAVRFPAFLQVSVAAGFPPAARHTATRVVPAHSSQALTLGGTGGGENRQRDAWNTRPQELLLRLVSRSFYNARFVFLDGPTLQ